MNEKQIIQSQFHASLKMLKSAIEPCPVELWLDESYKNRFWHIAYHVLFFTDLYLQQSEQEFQPWTKHIKDFQSLGQLPFPSHHNLVIEIPYTKNDILNYWSICDQKVDGCIDHTDLQGESGFEWLPFTKRELQFYNIRHIQHHAAQLIDRLRTQLDIEVPWIGCSS